MVSFYISLVLLVAGYFVYGKFVEKVFGVSADRKTPAATGKLRPWNTPTAWIILLCRDGKYL